VAGLVDDGFVRPDGFEALRTTSSPRLATLGFQLGGSDDVLRLWKLVPIVAVAVGFTLMNGCSSQSTTSVESTKIDNKSPGDYRDAFDPPAKGKGGRGSRTRSR